MDPKQEAIKELLIKMADDQLIIGHRHSEWIGLGPILEEDIALASIAQDKVGQSYTLFQLLHDQFGTADPDTMGFLRAENEYRCCHLVEYPNGEYDFSLIRHFLFDHAEYHRFDMLQASAFEPIRGIARKFKSEIKYHILHADVWVRRLGTGTEESHQRMQAALETTFPLALGIFEPSPYEQVLIEENIFPGEDALRQRWLETIQPILEEASLQMPDPSSVEPAYGGRRGYHTEHLAPLLEEMSWTLRYDPEAERW